MKEEATIEGVQLTDWQKEVLKVFDKIKNHTKPYEVEIGGMKITVLPEVFSPKYFTDSLWFAEELAKMVGDSKLLEIGTGTGIVAVKSALSGAHVVATDINSAAVDNAKINAKRNSVTIDVRIGSVYEPLQPSERFDYIFWNHPFNNWEEPVDDILLRAGLDYQYGGLREYIKGAHHHVTERGKLLLGTGDNADLTSIQRIAREYGYELNLLKETEVPLEDGGDVLNKYLIFELIPS